MDNEQEQMPKAINKRFQMENLATKFEDMYPFYLLVKSKKIML